MSIEDESIATLEVDTYNAIALQEYDGRYGLLALERGKNDVLYKKWVFLSRWSKLKGGPVPGDKKLPMAVRLGDKQKAIAVLTEILKSLQE